MYADELIREMKFAIWKIDPGSFNGDKQVMFQQGAPIVDKKGSAATAYHPFIAEDSSVHRIFTRPSVARGKQFCGNLP